MAPKSQTASGAIDQPNPASSSAKDTPDAGTPNVRPDSHPNSPSPTQSTAQNTSENASNAESVTKTTVAGSDPSAKDAMSGPSPYGTRSRNRGQPRPNYAEDKDVDADMFDAYPEKKEQEPKKSRQTTNGSADAPRTGGAGARKVAIADEGKTASPQPTINKDQAVPTTTTAVVTAQPTTTSTKKRKAATQPVTNGAQAHASPAGAQNSATTRRATNNATSTVISGSGYRETNMLSFDRHGAKPKDGRLVADDGTVIEKNGRSIR